MFPRDRKSPISWQGSAETLLAFFPYVEALALVQQLHAQTIINGLHKAVLFGSKITNAYVESGSLPLASRAFDQITTKNLHSWNTIISGYSNYRFHGDVLRLFGRLRSEGNAVDTFNLVFAIKASSRLSVLQNGRLFHGLAVKSGLEADLYVVPALLEMYAELGSLKDAHKLFERFSYRSSFIWRFMIKGYLKFSLESIVFDLLSNVAYFGFQKDAFIMEGLIRACANVFAVREGKASHGLSIRYNLLDCNVCLRTSVVHMYMKCGFPHYAVRLFEEASNKDVVLWSAVIDGCAKNGRFWEAMSLFRKMLRNLVTPNPVTLASILFACSGVGSFKQGKSVHGFVIRNRVDLDVVSYTSLVDMYAKCGCVKTAYRIFCMMREKNVVSWTAMINAFGMHCLYLEALATFDHMRSEKHMPNAVTFVSVLSACSYSGMVQEGWRIFNSMSKDYAISLTEEHYACMIDLLARAGQIEEALSFISNMPIKAGASTWGALLNALQIHNRVELAEEVAKKLSSSDPNDSSRHVSLSNLYAGACMWEMVENTRMKMSEEELNKSLGFTSIEVQNKLRVFNSDDTLACKSTEINHLWNSLIKEMRESTYVPGINFCLL